MYNIQMLLHTSTKLWNDEWCVRRGSTCLHEEDIYIHYSSCGELQLMNSLLKMTFYHWVIFTFQLGYFNVSAIGFLLACLFLVFMTDSSHCDSIRNRCPRRRPTALSRPAWDRDNRTSGRQSMEVFVLLPSSGCWTPCPNNVETLTTHFLSFALLITLKWCFKMIDDDCCLSAGPLPTSHVWHRGGN